LRTLKAKFYLPVQMEGASVKRVAVVTGGNKGIGLGVSKELAKLPNYVTILTSRNEAAGRAAVAALRTSSHLCRLIFRMNHP
jgi:NAD(P)-dependent dehydrogenase (short-subunit alcohol dehydrogenase family)